MFFTPPTNKTRDGRAEGHEKGLRAKVRPLNLFLYFLFLTFPCPDTPSLTEVTRPRKHDDQASRTSKTRLRGSGRSDWG